MENNKLTNKAKRVNNKFSNQMEIVSVNVELTPKEKIAIYEKMLKKLNLIEKRSIMSCDFAEGVVSISKGLSKGSVPNFLSTILGVSGLGLGITSLAMAPQHMNPSLAIGAGIVSTVAGVAMLTNAVLNSDVFTQTPTDKLEMKAFNNYDDLRTVLNNIRRNVEKEIVTNQELMGIEL